MSMKSLKKKLAMLSMAAMATVAPIATHAQETKAESKDVRQEQFTAVLKKNITPDTIKKEAIKYIDFPDFIPVTPEGKFDSKTSQEWIKNFDLEKNFSTVKTFISDMRKGVSSKDALQKFVENVSINNSVKKEELKEFAPLIAGGIEKIRQDRDESTGALCLAAGFAALGIGAITMNHLKRKDMKQFFNGVELLVAGGIVTGALMWNFQSDSTLKKEIKETIPKVHQAMYDGYVKQAIETGKNKIVTMDAKQAAQMVKFSQSQQALKAQTLKNMSQSVK